MADVARVAGVSPAAVSLALRDHPKSRKFKPETLQRIHESARKLDYRTNFFFSLLRRSSSRVIMVYVPTLQDLYAGALAESFQNRASQRDYWTMVSGTEGLDRPVIDQRVIGSHGISAVVFAAAALEYVNKKAIQKLVREGVHIVVIGREKPCEGVSATMVEDGHGGMLAAEHVYGLGAKDVWLLARSGEAKASTSHRRSNHGPTFSDRNEAFTDYARRNNLPVPKVLNVPTFQGSAPFDKAGDSRHIAMNIVHQSHETVRQHLQQGSTPQAIVGIMDLQAMGVYRALDEAGIRPGRDVAVVGYDDIWPAETMTPPLTTIHQPTGEMGEMAADILIDAIEGRIRPGRRINVEPELIVRDSTRLWKPRS